MLLLGGPRVLLLQIAHPLVAAGVAEFSSFRADPLERLRRTLDSTLSIVFGTTAQAEAAVARINGVHAAVHGTLPQRAGRYPAGTYYDATDPELLLWVHATLVDTSFAVYTRFVGPLHADELELAYAESKTAARALGVPDRILPPDVSAFRHYVDDMLASDRIAVAPFQRAIAGDILDPPLRFLPRAVNWPMVAITTALLPANVRAAFGLELTPARRRVADWSMRTMRGIVPLVPRALREMPQARRADRRNRADR